MDREDHPAHKSEDPEQGSEGPAIELDQSHQQLRLLLDVNNAIISNLTRESLFHAIAEALRKVIPFDRAVLPIYDAEKDVFRRFALEGQSLLGQEVNSEIQRHGSHSGWVFDHRRPLLKQDVQAERELPSDEIVLAGGIRSYMIVPLIARDKVFGTLFVASCTPNRYSSEDVALLQAVAKQIALAIENMLAYEEIARLRARLEEENRYLQEEIKSGHNFDEIVGQSRAIKEVFKAIAAVAPAGATVLIIGETGTGKELVARALHNLSPRGGKALIKVNCAALPAGLIESELFGHEKGAFTGAIARKIGRFELAHGGTLFLDEIGDLPPELQPKLLRVLQEGEFERIGASHTTTVDVRVIAATNRDLETAIRENRFRSDLYYRLNVFPIRLPPLRERTEDIPLLVRYLTLKHGTRLGKRIANVSPAIMKVLQTYSWPGNVRELENVIERATILSEGAELDLGGWPVTTGDRGREGGTGTLEDVDREHIRAVLKLTGWLVSGERGAARHLGIKPTTLEARMKKLGITRKE
jgi:formate hydrogenlyase transcriptional activator